MYFQKNNQISNFMKIHPVWGGAELFHWNRRTDMTKIIVAYRNLRTRPKTPTVPCIKASIFFLINIISLKRNQATLLKEFKNN